MFYVRIPRLSGRYAFYNLVNFLESAGYGDRVDYFEGDGFTASHLRFMFEDDVVAFCLTKGYSYTEDIPKIKDD